jgi:hypothetical protein
MKVSRSLVIVIALIVIALGAAAFFYFRTDPRVEKLFGGKNNLLVVTSPTRVQAYRIKPLNEQADSGVPNIFGYPIISGPIDVGSNSAQRIGNILASSSTYEWGTVKRCAFMPGVALTFTRDDEQVTVLFCFSCYELGVVVDGKRVGHEDFDSQRKNLLEVMKHLFPADKEIQALKSEVH